MEPVLLWQKLWQVETKRMTLAIGMVVSLIIAFQSLFLAHKNVNSLIPGISFQLFGQNTSSNGEALSGEVLLNDSENKSEAPVMVGRFKQKEDSEGDFGLYVTKEEVRGSEDGITEDKARYLGNDSSTEDSSIVGTSSTGKQANERIFRGRNMGPCQTLPPFLSDTLILKCFPTLRKKGWLPRKTIFEMNNILLQSRVSSHAMKPRWPSARDHELLSAKLQIENASLTVHDPHLYAPLFRNVSMFTRSYELMERLLKVYVYKDGEKPIFHQPGLFGVYGSEGWFMKLLENNKHFVVKNPKKAHLFYLPFSSRKLRFTFADRGLNRRQMAAYLRQYVDLVAAKYPFWNRTGGADHFFAACHDWAPYLTRNKLEASIRVLCNADLSEGFKLGKDASLPVTFVRNVSNPLKDLGGLPATERPTLAFFSGSRHGPVREILLKYWENKDTDPAMKIFGPTQGLMNESAYVQHMKSSRYCICARGYGVHTPRVVEAIFYECVPVIISDNYVPPFFEIFDWEAFAVFVPEIGIPKLKDILLSIPEEKYLTMQGGVKRVQQHFLWHANPIKYDVFHMILHSVWFSRLNRLK
ncbi:hypothetical protein H6P81_009141 [Aristolochia fimbriata]|uniref:Exostosin GT47 domain-containing protein n=1 Tax=Aristolochia fimbriata TaxID=158543 RepID=A0AAV7EN73_ARIFI|nr:hypothetical protein H6P81_009141 [Aristolochia fimbriata]